MNYLIWGVIALVLSVLFGIFIIPMLRRLKFGQEIREEGPAWHASKSGTPTMGGIIFILSIIVTLVAMFVWTASDGISMGNTVDLVLVILLSLAFGACLLYTSPSPRDRG